MENSELNDKNDKQGNDDEVLEAQIQKKKEKCDATYYVSNHIMKYKTIHFNFNLLCSNTKYLKINSIDFYYLFLFCYFSYLTNNQ